MRFFYISLFLLGVSIVSAQSINQFDTNGKRHGIWQKKFDKTQVLRYEGEFRHGKEIGLFKFYKKIDNRPILTASKQFNETNNIAHVKFLSSRGKVISEGKMEGKKYIGEWKYYQRNSNGLLILENYDDSGNLNGLRNVYYKNGQVAEKQHYVGGKLEGESVWYSERSVKIKEFIYVNGELHGESKYYNPRGELITQGHYQNGKKYGIWRFFENGKITKQEDFTHKNKYKKKVP